MDILPIKGYTEVDSARLTYVIHVSIGNISNKFAISEIILLKKDNISKVMNVLAGIIYVGKRSVDVVQK